ncbi:MAG TPA: recombinase family protein [Candidatus Saccharimonadales bacterium]|nr:recombinase family protein [Candidatus Saccharimonadales bacterium]
MSRQILAITTCRVSTPEQMENNSLGRQAEAVVAAAKELGATIPIDGQWSGSVSSKAGTNIKRKDLMEMLDYCKKHPLVKYLIVHEVDRFMRSIKELFYFEVEFEKLGVKVWYASQPDLNTDDYKSKLFKALEAFKGEGSNVERITKSIEGQTTALRQGKYPFSPKPGYRRGYERGVQEIHPVRGLILKAVLIRIATRVVTPSQALVELNQSDFVKGRSLYKMDKFRKIVTDPFYAGIVEIDKQVKVRNKNGLHQALISEEQHNELVRIMNSKKKTQSGARKNGNPKYPLSNHVSCTQCTEKTNGRFVGFDHGNGKNPALVYEKYRCRACGRYIARQDLHQQIEEQFNRHSITPKGRSELSAALAAVWKEKEGEAAQEVIRLQHRVETLNINITNHVEAATDPSNAAIKDDILLSITTKKAEVASIHEKLAELTSGAERDREQFLEFAFDFIENMGSQFFSISRENRLRCKELVFPSGFYLDTNNKVYTPEISPLYRLASKKKDLPEPEKSLLVRVRGL